MAVDLKLNSFGIVFGITTIIFGILDIISTNLVLSSGGVELNPLVNWIMSETKAQWQSWKLGFHIIIGFLLFWIPYNRGTAFCGMLLIGFYTVVVSSNFLIVL